jgi:predicted esterase
MKKNILMVIFFSFCILSFIKSAAIAESAPGRTINTSQYILYIPSGIEENNKYPLVLALSPGADAQGMIRTWIGISERFKWLIIASKESRNGVDMKQMGNNLVSLVRQVSFNYPVDPNKIIASGFSGGGMLSHYLIMYYPKVFSAIVVNTCMISENYSSGKTYYYPRDKIAVFLASPADFRYKQMISDRSMLKNFGWKTKWIEFSGGHTIAPNAVYLEAAEWLKEQF